MTNEVLKTIYERRSVKKYSDKPVPKELLERINYIKTGSFKEELKTTVKPFVGSTNQEFRRLR